jgi:SAM-dependent methyltransferase
MERPDDARAEMLRSRPVKARRIIEFLARERPVAGSRVLDFGTGAGLIAQEFLAAVGPQGEVVAADVANRLASDRVAFTQIVDGRVAAPERHFDFVVSNHVLEHVGPPEAQLGYLAECRRLLRDDGVLYLATPNRWTVFEPHYRLPLVSWWPVGWRSGYLRLLRRFGLKSVFKLSMDDYAIWPQANAALRRLVVAAGFVPVEVTPEVLVRSIELETSGVVQRLLVRLAPLLYRAGRPIVPTHVLICRKSAR